jgi:hypothetical protein
MGSLRWDNGIHKITNIWKGHQLIKLQKKNSEKSAVINHGPIDSITNATEKYS